MLRDQRRPYLSLFLSGTCLGSAISRLASEMALLADDVLDLTSPEKQQGSVSPPPHRAQGALSLASQTTSEKRVLRTSHSAVSQGQTYGIYHRLQMSAGLAEEGAETHVTTQGRSRRKRARPSYLEAYDDGQVGSC